MKQPRIRIVQLLLIIVCALLTFGGSFTCSSHSGDGNISTSVNL